MRNSLTLRLRPASLVVQVEPLPFLFHVWFWNTPDLEHASFFDRPYSYDRKWMKMVYGVHLQFRWIQPTKTILVQRFDCVCDFFTLSMHSRLIPQVHQNVEIKHILWRTVVLSIDHVPVDPPVCSILSQPGRHTGRPQIPLNESTATEQQ